MFSDDFMEDERDNDIKQEVSFMGTLIVGAILILIVGLIIRGIVRDKKSGKSSCGGDCSHCRGCH